MHKMRNQILSILLFLFLLLGGILIFDHRTVKLKYIGQINATSNSDLAYVYNGTWTVTNDLAKKLEGLELLLSRLSKADVALSTVTFNYEKGRTYYIGVACRINKISFKYHTRQNHKKFKASSVELTPGELGKLYIYEGDVMAVEFLD